MAIGKGERAPDWPAPRSSSGRFADDLIDGIVPAQVDWRGLVREHPLPALGAAALAGYFLARHRGAAILAGLSALAASVMSDVVDAAVDDFSGQDLL